MVRGSLAEAEKAFRSAVKAAEDIDERDLAVAYNRVGDVPVAQGNLPEAFKFYRDSLAIVDRLAKTDPGNAGWQRDLAVSYGRVATVERRLNAREEAVRKFRLGRGIIEHLAQRSPNNTVLAKDLAWFNGCIADLTKIDT